MPVQQRVEEAGFPSNLAQVPDFHCLIYGGCGQEPITARVQGHVGHFLFVHSQIPKLQRRARFRWGVQNRGWGSGREGEDLGSRERTSLPSMFSRITFPTLSPVTTTRLLTDTSRLQNQKLEGETVL